MSQYAQPPAVLADLVNDSTPGIILSSNREYLLTYDFPSLLSLEDVCQPEVRVAGLRFDPKLRSASRLRWSTWATIRNLRTQQEVSIQVPPQTRMRKFSFSPTSRLVSFLVSGQESTEVWVASTSTGQAHKVQEKLNSVLSASSSCQWTRTDLLLMLVFDSNLPVPEAPRVPFSPEIQESLGHTKTPARTYHDLLTTPHDEHVFEFYATSRIVLVDPLAASTTTTTVRLHEEPNLYFQVEMSPDLCHVLVHYMVRPYSKLLPCSRFSKRIVRLDFSGPLQQPLDKILTAPEIVLVANIPVQENLSTSFDARPVGPRQVEFVWNLPHQVCFVQALDGGEPSQAPDAQGNRDGLFFFQEGGLPPSLQFAVKFRIDDVKWVKGQEIMLVWESWYKTREEVCHVVNTKQKTTHVLYAHSSDDAYADWGSPRMELDLETGYWTLKQQADSGRVYFYGEGASEIGNRPFLDAVDVNTKTKTRVWQSPIGPPAVFQRALDFVVKNQAPLFLSEDSLLIMSESQTEPPNVFLVRAHNPLKEMQALTQFPHPQPSLLGVRKELIRYKRADGVELSATLLLPPPQPGVEKYPLLCWAYPEEFKSKEHASQVKSSPNRFIRTSWSEPTLWLARGWAVLDHFSVPIVATLPNAEPNDDFTAQLVSSAQAAVEECKRRNVVDGDKIAVGGHSYGAYMTTHLLAHTRLFKAGIARSGAYNRSLTPFGYQSEERTFWEAKDMYMQNSPLAHADKIQDALLLIHGKEDQNPGTHVLQTERLFGALQGLGKKARMVLLPFERHGYDAAESVLHVIAEQDAFLCKHVLGEDVDQVDQASKRARI